MKHWEYEGEDRHGRSWLIVNEDEWRNEVIKAITELTQHVHALNPGIAFGFDLAVIRAPWDGQAIEDEE